MWEYAQGLWRSAVQSDHGDDYRQRKRHGHTDQMLSSRTWKNRLVKPNRVQVNGSKYAMGSINPVQCSAGHDDGSIRVWNLESGACIDLRHHANTVTCLAMAQVSEVDELLFSAGDMSLSQAPGSGGSRPLLQTCCSSVALLALL